VSREPVAAPHHARPYRVSRWGKFWSLEPLFADERTYLVAKSGYQPQVGELVLAVPAKGNRLRIVERLGDGDDLSAVLRALLYAEDVPQGFDAAVADEAAAVLSRRERRDPGRRDLTALPTFTIDPDAARDFDDAISVARDGEGYRAHVHIADVSYFVDPDGAIDVEARQRTASVYLPLWAEPMLPRALSDDVCSLRAGEDRKTLTVEFTFSGQGERQSTSFYRSLIRSDYRLTYGFVDRILAPEAAAGEAQGRSGNAAGEPPAALTEQLLVAQELAVKLRRWRFARGALRIASFEPEYRFDGAGELTSATARPETASHALVEEYMLAANEAVAGYLSARRAQAIYRVHEPPEAYSTDALLAQFEELGVPTPSFPSPERATREQISRAMGRLSETISTVAAQEGRGRLAFPALLLRSLKQAYYGAENLGHFGLASQAYLHFTSPIRRYPDLVVHRALLKHLGDGGVELSAGELAAVAAVCSMEERAIAKIELKADDIALAFLLEGTLREQGWETIFSGEIIGLVGGGIFVHFGGCFEGYLPVRELPGRERYNESLLGTAQVGQTTGRRYRLGDTVKVRVNHVDRVRGRVDLLPAGEAPRGQRDGAGQESAGAGRGPGRPAGSGRTKGKRAPGGGRRARGAPARRPGRW
jgi:ribonuclease R